LGKFFRKTFSLALVSPVDKVWLPLTETRYTSRRLLIETGIPTRSRRRRCFRAIRFALLEQKSYDASDHIFPENMDLLIR